MRALVVLVRCLESGSSDARLDDAELLAEIGAIVTEEDEDYARYIPMLEAILNLLELIAESQRVVIKRLDRAAAGRARSEGRLATQKAVVAND
jgi:hypothetical protein